MYFPGLISSGMSQGGGLGALGCGSFLMDDFISEAMVAPGASCHILFVLYLHFKRVECYTMITSRGIPTLYALSALSIFSERYFLTL